MTPNKKKIDLGLNPVNYTVEDDVQMHILEA
jgi:hypothetical protein